MKPHKLGRVAGLATGVVFGLAVLMTWPRSPDGPEARGAAADGETAVKARPGARAVPMPAGLVGIGIELGRKDAEPTAWDGEVNLSGGRLREMLITRAGPRAKVEGQRFVGRSVKQGPMERQIVVGPILRLSIEAPPTATVNVKTVRGEFSFALKDVAAGKPALFLDGAAAVERQSGGLRLTGRDTEDDSPTMARATDGTIWLAYVEYRPGRPIVVERVQAGGWEELTPKGNGDQVLLVRFDGKAWQPALEVTVAGLDVQRPAVAVDGKGRVCIAWSQQIEGNWDIYYRWYTPGEGSGEGTLSEVQRLTSAPGTDFGVVAATDAKGVVWLAWQGWRQDNFEILAAALAEKHPFARPRTLTTSKANDWSPAIATNAAGDVFVAHDTYDKGDYDVRLCRIRGEEIKTWMVADSAKFEARPSLACDAAGRLWIAYEEGEEQWGKDYSNPQFRRIGLEKNPGSALYTKRTVRLKCLVDDKLMRPASEPPEVGGVKQVRKKSLPRLAVDSAGRVWLLFRQHPRLGTPGGAAGEGWVSYATHYDGQEWSLPQPLAGSDYLIDDRPALVPLGANLLAVYTGDDRLRTQNRGQCDLFAAVLFASGAQKPVRLIEDQSGEKATLPAVHPEEAADVARLREARIEAGGKTYRLIRGEFHRHSEFSSHGDIDGLLEDSYRYALDAGRLDWMGNGDHDNGFGHEFMWWLIQKTADLYQHAPHFIAAYSYERSVVYPNGHRNVIMPRRGIRPMPRTDLKGTPEKGTPDTKLLYAYLKHFGAICASHTSGTTMGTDWRDNDPLVEPVVEIYQGHRHNYEHFGAPRSATRETQIGGYEPAGYVWNAFEKGYRFGFESSSDHVSTHMSYGVILVEEPSRQAIIDGFKKRRSYAATDNILLVVRSGDHLMGEAFETARRPTLTIRAHGTADIARLHVIKNNKYVYSTEPGTKEVKELRYTDMEASAGSTSYYYVRIEQADGNLAWASPLWITYKP
jgi:hypothetical protein